MNRHGNKQIDAGSRSVKLSPDCVATTGFRHPTAPFTSDHILNYKHPGLNVPPIHTPLMHRTVRKVLPSSTPPKPPPLPCRSPITGRRPRSVSEGEASIGSNRRAIFGHYWNNKDKICDDASETTSNGSLRRRTQIVPPCVRKRSSSISILESAALPPETVDYRMYAPPSEHRSAICSRFAPVDAVPPLEALPPLPTPLRRLCPEGGGRGCLHGMYPLVTPVPVLKQSSYRSLRCDGTNSSPSTPRTQSDPESFNSTQSHHLKHDASFASRSSSSMSNSDGSSRFRGVHFDPRITVTEFEDSVEREWYDDFELMRLKHETVLLAQEYLMTHQHEAEKYNKVKLDPVTGTYRKRALFSLPVLSSTTDDHSRFNPDCANHSETVGKHVKNILIVDPNPAIQALFCKSMKSMFPGAEVHTSQSGEEALKLISAQLNQEYGSTAFQHRNFDIIIVEQRLCQYLHNPKATENREANLTENNSCLSIPSLNDNDNPPRRLQKPSSFAGSEGGQVNRRINMCGSDLVRAIQDLEMTIFAASNNQLNSPNHRDQNDISTSDEKAISVPTKLIHWRSLLIGVSMQPDRDAGVLTEAGADVIWGKPIPHIGDALRNQLVQALVNKRRKCAVASE